MCSTEGPAASPAKTMSHGVAAHSVSPSSFTLAPGGSLST